jgi:hypothetical protein
MANKRRGSSVEFRLIWSSIDSPVVDVDSVEEIQVSRCPYAASRCMFASAWAMDEPDSWHDHTLALRFSAAKSVGLMLKSKSNERFAKFLKCGSKAASVSLLSALSLPIERFYRWLA